MARDRRYDRTSQNTSADWDEATTAVTQGMLLGSERRSKAKRVVCSYPRSLKACSLKVSGKGGGL